MQREIICDEFVSEKFNDTKTYMNTLVKLEEQKLLSSIPALAAKSDKNSLLKRFKLMNHDFPKRRINIQHYVLIILVLVLGFILYSLTKNKNSDTKIFANDQTYSSGIQLEYSYFTDSRDGQSYKIIKIYGKWWMAENLNYNCEGSWYYNNDKEKGNKWGRLYTWSAIKKACPDGWHVASDDEWLELERYFGVGPTQLEDLGWRNSGIGEFFRNKELLNIVDGGYRPYGDGTFDDGGDDAYYWTSTSVDNTDAWKRFFSGKKMGRGFDDKRKAFSVRCVKN
jgi:uncharacterized protein (TIGR02145 family)